MPNDDPGDDARMGKHETSDDVAMCFLGSLEIGHSVVDFLLEQPGSVRKSHRRETRPALQRVISEIVSPPIVTAEIRRTRNQYFLPWLRHGIDHC